MSSGSDHVSKYSGRPWWHNTMKTQFLLCIITIYLTAMCFWIVMLWFFCKFQSFLDHQLKYSDSVEKQKKDIFTRFCRQNIVLLVYLVQKNTTPYLSIQAICAETYERTNLVKIILRKNKTLFVPFTKIRTSTVNKWKFTHLTSKIILTDFA